jgi:hypothetical protein
MELALTDGRAIGWQRRELMTDPRQLSYWPYLSKSIRRLVELRLTPDVLDVDPLGKYPVSVTDRSPRSVVTAEVPANVRVNNPSEDTGSGTTQSETSLAVASPYIVVTFNDSNRSAGFSGYSNSNDGGLDFNDDIDISTNLLDLGDGVACVDRSGAFFVAFLRATDATFNSMSVQVARSTDNGTTFGAAVNASDGIAAAGDSMDKEWIAVDTTGGSTDGRLYVAFTRFLASGAGTLVTTYSTDHGATWATPQTVSPPVAGSAIHQGASLAVAPNGDVYVAWLDRVGGNIMLRKSTDGGATYINSVTGGGVVATIAMVGKLNGGFEAESFPSIAIGPDGNVYISYHAAALPDQSNVYLTRSTDGGLSWSAPLKVSDDTGTTDQFQPSVAVTSSNVVGVMFYDRRNDPSNTNIDVYLAMSLDQASTFLPNQRITETSFPPAVNFDPKIRTDYMGDYNQMVVVGTRFHLVWGDNRDTVGARNDPDVFYAQIGTEDCYIRDNLADDGYPPSQAGQAWQSPDIQPAMSPTIFGTINPVTLVVHNHGPKSAANVSARLYWADPATYIPRAAWRPDRITVGGVATNEQTIATVPSAATATPPQTFDWDPPPPAWATEIGHFCLLAEIESPGDPLRDANAGGWKAIEGDNNLAVRNVHVQPMGNAPVQIRFLIGTEPKMDIRADLVVDGRLIPVGWQVALRIDPAIAAGARISNGKLEEKVDDRQLEAELQRRWRRLHGDDGATYVATPAGRIQLLRRTVLRIEGIRLPAGSGSLAAIDFVQTSGTLGKAGQLRITQRIDGQVVGGLLYLLTDHTRG